MASRTAILIDLSSVAYPLWHTSQGEPDPNAISRKIVERVRALASGTVDGVAVCYDTGKSFRSTVDPTYKATRPKDDDRALLHHQIDTALDLLRNDGFPCWGVKGFEADDVIATAASLVLEGADRSGEASIIICTSDKDLLQLVRPDGRCVVKGLKDGSILDRAAVVEKLKVEPGQVRDYLTLVGDKADNIVGAKGIGEVGAAKLLLAHGSLDALYEKMKAGGALKAGLTLNQAQSLGELLPRLPVVRDLLTLRTDVPIPFAQLWEERDEHRRARFMAAEMGKPVVQENPFGIGQSDISAAAQELADRIDDRIAKQVYQDVYSKETPVSEKQDDIAEAMPTLSGADKPKAEQDAINANLQDARERIHRAAEAGYQKAAEAAGATPRPPVVGPSTVPAVALPGQRPAQGGLVYDQYRTDRTQVIIPPPFERALESRNLEEAFKTATILAASRLFGAYAGPEGVFSTILAGRELGMPTMTSLRSFHIIDGKPVLTAGAIVALVLRSGLAEYFECSERTADHATYVTKRRTGRGLEVALTFTLAEGRQGFAGTDDAFKKSGWGRNSADMCVARASSKLARLVYADVVANLYSMEELTND